MINSGLKKKPSMEHKCCRMTHTHTHTH